MALPLSDAAAHMLIDLMRQNIDSIEKKLRRHGGLAAAVRTGAASTISGQVHEVAMQAAVLERRIDAMTKKAALG